MPIGSGISAQVGIAEESTYGTPVTVTRFYEFNSEGIKPEIAKVYSRGLRAARFQRSDRVKTYLRGAAGPIEMDVLNKGFGLWFKHALGQNTVTGAGANRTHTCIPDANAQQGKSLTVQVGRPDSTGTVRPFTYEGGKITGFELRWALGEPVKFVPTLDFENYLTATALAAASYPATQEAFVGEEGALTIAGTPIAVVKSAVIKYQAGLKVDRRGLGNTKREPLANAEAMIEISVDAEFDDLTQHAALLAGTQVAVVLTATTATVIPTTAVPFSLAVNIDAAEYTAVDANVSGPDVLPETFTLKGLDNGVDPPIEIVYVTNDTTP